MRIMLIFNSDLPLSPLSSSVDRNNGSENIMMKERKDKDPQKVLLGHGWLESSHGSIARIQKGLPVQVWPDRDDGLPGL